MSAQFDFAQFPTLETERLVLRQITTADTETVLSIFGDPEVVRYMKEAEQPLTRYEEAREIVDWTESIFVRKTGIRWAITLKGNPQLIGTCGFYAWNSKNRHADVGYELARQHWRQGIMFEAMQRVLHFCFVEMDMHRIGADVTAGNQASAQLLLKLGFKQEGTWREREYLFERFVDLWLFGLLRHEWESN
ncbi:MAG: GNAT family N-acetyltransferase [Anaerolineae bacterium]|nr:GNAT family N-acetyltransferase [Anaerolineae bacterium]